MSNSKKNAFRTKNYKEKIRKLNCYFIENDDSLMSNNLWVIGWPYSWVVLDKHNQMEIEHRRHQYPNAFSLNFSILLIRPISIEYNAWVYEWVIRALLQVPGSRLLWNVVLNFFNRILENGNPSKWTSLSDCVRRDRRTNRDSSFSSIGRY